MSGSGGGSHGWAVARGAHHGGPVINRHLESTLSLSAAGGGTGSAPPQPAPNTLHMDASNPPPALTTLVAEYERVRALLRHEDGQQYQGRNCPLADRATEPCTSTRVALLVLKVRASAPRTRCDDMEDAITTAFTQRLRTCHINAVRGKWGRVPEGRRKAWEPIFTAAAVLFAYVERAKTVLLSRFGVDGNVEDPAGVGDRAAHAAPQRLLPLALIPLLHARWVVEGAAGRREGDERHANNG